MPAAAVAVPDLEGRGEGEDVDVEEDDVTRFVRTFRQLGGEPQSAAEAARDKEADSEYERRQAFYRDTGTAASAGGALPLGHELVDGFSDTAADPDVSLLERSWLAYESLHAAAELEPTTASESEAVRPHRLVLFGDSDVDYWIGSQDPGEEQDWIPELAPEEQLQVLKVGLAGACMSDIAYYAARCRAKYRPSIVVLVGGENDFWDGSVDAEADAAAAPSGDERDPNSTVARAFKLFRYVCELFAAQGTRVIYLSCKPEPATIGVGSDGELHRRYREYDDKIQEFFLEKQNEEDSENENNPGRGQRFFFVDSWTLVGGTAESDVGRFSERDRLHLSAEGYVIWREEIARIVREEIGGVGCLGSPSRSRGGRGADKSSVILPELTRAASGGAGGGASVNLGGFVPTAGGGGSQRDRLAARAKELGESLAAEFVAQTGNAEGG